MDPNIQKLLEELKSDKEDTRKRAVIALGRYNGTEVLEALRKTLNDPSTAVRYFAKKAVKEMETALVQGPAGASGPIPDGAATTEAAIAGIAKQPTPAASAPDAVKASTQSETRLDKKEIFSGSESIMSILDALKDPDEKVRIDAIKKLGEMKEVVATEPLLNLIHAESRDVRLYAVQSLGYIKDQKALTPMLNLLNSEADPFVNATLVKAIARVGGVQLIPILARYLKDDDPRVRANTVESLEIIGDQKIIKFLVPLLQDPNSRVKANVVKVLSKFGKLNMLEKLAEMLESKETDTRASAVYALGAIGSEVVLPLLLRALEDPSAEIVVRAVEAIAKVGDAATIEKTRKLLTHQNPVVRGAVEKALGGVEASAVEAPTVETPKDLPVWHEGLSPEDFDRLWTEINERLYRFAKTHPTFTKKEMANFLDLLRESILFSS
jgi:HEAT repeat protein